MSANTKIEWCHATVNHWAGCTAVSPACDNCYAKLMAGRLWGTEWGAGKPRHQFEGAYATLRALASLMELLQGCDPAHKLTAGNLESLLEPVWAGLDTLCGDLRTVDGGFSSSIN